MFTTLRKVDVVPSVQVAWLCLCEKLRVDMAITWHGVGYIVCIVCHVLAYEMRCVITRLSSD